MRTVAALKPKVSGGRAPDRTALDTGKPLPPAQHRLPKNSADQPRVGDSLPMQASPAAWTIEMNSKAMLGRRQRCLCHEPVRSVRDRRLPFGSAPRQFAFDMTGERWSKTFQPRADRGRMSAAAADRARGDECVSNDGRNQHQPLALRPGFIGRICLGVAQRGARPKPLLHSAEVAGSPF